MDVHIGVGMGTKKLGTQTRQRQILEAALQITLENGLSGLNITGLASRSGLVPAGIYRHFSSKDEIVDAVLYFLRNRLFAFIESIREETPDALERLHLLLTRHLKLLLDHPGIPQIVFSDGIFSQVGNGFTKTSEIIEGYLERVEQIVREGQVSRRICPGLDPKTVSVMFFGMILPVVILVRATSGEFDVEKHVAKAWPTFVSAITVHANGERNRDYENHENEG
ncbi:TetR/AcrR family transcriptional regulator [Thermodesulfobacteriota bacterium]